MNIAVAHKDFDVRGGAEILAETLAHGLDAPLIVGHDDPENREQLAYDVPIRELAPGSRWHTLAAAGGVRRAIAHMVLWRDHADAQLKEYDTVVISGNEPHWWLPREDQTVIAYTHSTPRALYDLSNDQRGYLTRTFTQLKRWLLQQEVGVGIDMWVANSDVVARRMSRYWGIDQSSISVVYPPIDVDGIDPALEATGEYYLMLGRLSENKRIREVVHEANRVGFELRVVGGGPLYDELSALAGDTVEILGWMSEEDKNRYLAGAKAMINAASAEDFGMSVIEALASGTPVLTVPEGMPRFTVQDGTRGIHFQRGELAGAIRTFEATGVEWSESQLREWTRQNFGTSRFVREMTEAVERAQSKTTISPAFSRTSQTQGAGETE